MSTIVKVSESYLLKLILLIFLYTLNLPAEVLHKVPVGVSLALSGSGAAPSLDIQDGLMFANKHYFHNKYEFIIEDDRCDNNQGLAIANKFVNQNKVKYALGFLCNSVLLATAPVYRKAGTLIITSGATSGDIKNIGERIFRSYPADQLAIDPLFKYIIKQHYNVGILTQLDAYSELMEQTFLNNAKHTKLKVNVEQVDSATIDFKPVLLRLKAKGIQGLFLNLLGEPNYVIAVKQMRELGIDLPVYSNTLAGSELTQKTLGQLNEGAYFADLDLQANFKRPKFQDLLRLVNKDYGDRRSALIFTALGIDTLRILDLALKEKSKPEIFLKTLKFNGISGTLSFDADGAVQGLRYKLFRIKNSEAKVVQ